MPRFYFDVHEDGKVILDEEGLEFDSLDAAEREAAITAAEIGRECLPKCRTRNIKVEIRDQHGQRVCAVRVSIEVQRQAFAHT